LVDSLKKKLFLPGRGNKMADRKKIIYQQKNIFSSLELFNKKRRAQR
jgi:hypothetical protein